MDLTLNTGLLAVIAAVSIAVASGLILMYGQMRATVVRVDALLVQLDRAFASMERTNRRVASIELRLARFGVGGDSRSQPDDDPEGG